MVENMNTINFLRRERSLSLRTYLRCIAQVSQDIVGNSRVVLKISNLASKLFYEQKYPE